MFNSFFLQEHVFIFLFFIISTVLAIIIFGFSYNLALHNPNTEKLSPYECGFDPYEDARQTFDVRFYLVSILFIIFDLEAMYLFPWVVSLNSFNFWIMIDFIIELTIGLLYAWKRGSLEWE